MDEHQLHKIVLRLTGSDDLEELRERRQNVVDMLNLMSSNPSMNSDDLRSHLASSSLFTREELDGVVGLSSTRLLGHLNMLNVRLAIELRDVKGKQVCKMIEAKGYEVESEWQDNGLHVAISNPGKFRTVMVLSQEVLADWTPRQLFSRLEGHNWQLVVGATKSQKVLYYTNRGFQG
jgi:hypothetical protein